MRAHGFQLRIGECRRLRRAAPWVRTRGGGLGRCSPRTSPMSWPRPASRNGSLSATAPPTRRSSVTPSITSMRDRVRRDRARAPTGGGARPVLGEAGDGRTHALADRTNDPPGRRSGPSSSAIARAYRSWNEPPKRAEGFTPFERRSSAATHFIPSRRLADLSATSSDVASLPVTERDALLDRLRELARGLPRPSRSRSEATSSSASASRERYSRPSVRRSCLVAWVRPSVTTPPGSPGRRRRQAGATS